MNNLSQIAMHQSLSEPKLAFHPDRTADSDIHPLRGLINFGPHSTRLVLDPIRVATVAPTGDSSNLRAFMDRLEAKYSPRERSDYLPEWPGFHSVFWCACARSELLLPHQAEPRGRNQRKSVVNPAYGAH